MPSRTHQTQKRAAPPGPFDRYLDEHAGAVLAYLRSTVGRDAADDVFQEAFIAALRAWEPGLPAPGPGWIFRIAHNKAIDHHRAAARRPLSLAEPPEPAASDPDRLEAADLRRQVAALADGQRAAVSLRFFADLSYREVGVALDCSEQAARRRVADGLATLRDRYPKELR
ncbi:sigma-70 family RNA polymerase sigma factor [Thermoleophilia bacterium SCSIO 60948]|nr:sigma-70 family RNA polymerase sigma factor [Thermoleophilia bacterium SCSIO 60948]